MARMKLSALDQKLRQVSHSSLSEAIATQLIDLISNGELRPGQRLPAERDLCKKFGVGRSSLREALRCLSIVGVLDVRVGDGTFVANSASKFLARVFEWRVVTERDLHSLVGVRVALEGDSASNAAQLGTEEEFEHLQDIVQRMQTSLDNPTRFASLDLEFHLAVAKASQNQLMHDLLLMIRGQLTQLLVNVTLASGGTKIAYREHSAILEAILSRNADEANALMRAHLAAFQERARRAGAAR